MGTPLSAEHDDFAAWKNKIEQQLRLALARSATRPRLNITSGDFEVHNNGAIRVFGTGGLRLVSADAVSTFAVYGRGDSYTDPNGNPQPIIQIFRNDGSAVFQLADPLPLQDGYNQFWAWYDRTGSQVLGDDTTSGKGLARPYLSYDVSSGDDTVTLVSTATFAEAHLIAGYVQNPRMAVPVSVLAPSTGAGEVRIRHTGTGSIVAGPTAVPANTNVAPFYEFNVPAAVNMFEFHYFAVETRRTSGTGNMQSRVFNASGLQS